MGAAYIISLVGVLSMGLGALMLAPMGVSLIYGEAAWRAFLGGAVVSMVSGAALFWLFRPASGHELSHREGMAIVGISWAVAGLLGGVPLYFSGDFLSFTDAVFEAVSGFTTTGASVLTEVEKAGKGVLFWRSLTHWLGGMGFVVLSLAILPLVGVGGMQLFKAEVPSPTPDRLAPRIADTATLLWKVYAAITVAEIILLMAGGLDWFDATCHAFATMATGGFSTKNASVAGFNSAYVDWVITVFMVLAGMNFTLHFLVLRGRWNAFWRDEEWRLYMGTFLGSSLAIAAGLWLLSELGLGESLRLAAFQVATILTTTGFATADYSLWPPICLGLLIPLMFVGGSAGSTGGGPKVMRILVVLKQSLSEFRRLVHPRLVAPVRLNQHNVDRQVVSAVYSFIGLYMGAFVITGLLLAALGMNLVDSFSASIACLGNIGPGLGSVGPAGNYAHLPDLAKWLLSAVMIVGRLEIYTVLVLLVPDFWRR
ncbi:potassium transporter [Desulfocarbo indianensis]|nr:potassium transporter [Desulfocarbo indianensis]